MDDVLTPEEAAALFKVKVRTVYDWLQRGQIPGRKVGKVWRLSRRALVASLEPGEPANPVAVTKAPEPAA
jgi:excisionase family DNA binding protein